jgi:hypothetical protein
MPHSTLRVSYVICDPILYTGRFKKKIQNGSERRRRCMRDVENRNDRDMEMVTLTISK